MFGSIVGIASVFVGPFSGAAVEAFVVNETFNSVDQQHDQKGEVSVQSNTGFDISWTAIKLVLCRCKGRKAVNEYYERGYAQVDKELDIAHFVQRQIRMYSVVKELLGPHRKHLLREKIQLDLNDKSGGGDDYGSDGDTGKVQMKSNSFYQGEETNAKTRKRHGETDRGFVNKKRGGGNRVDDYDPGKADGG